MWVQSLGWEDSLEKEMAPHSSILAWKIPRTEDPGGLQSMQVPHTHTHTPLKLIKYLHTQLCLTLCDPVNCSPPGSSVHGILQVRMLEWVAVFSSRASF